jgi:GxxExxY protein
MDKNEISGEIVDAAMKVHSALGPGLLESAYTTCLRHELIKRGFNVKSEVPVPIVYDGVRLEAGYKLDLLVEDTVVVELKAIEALGPIHQAQIISYLKLARKPIGLLINFHSLHLKDGIKRFVV